MTPFRVFDKAEKQVWIILNFHPDKNGGGSYLAAKEDDSNEDGHMELIPATQFKTLKFVGFLEESEE